MAQGIKGVQARIRSVQNINKITKAMELVSVAKMKKSVAAVLEARPFAEHAWDVLQSLSSVLGPEAHPFLYTAVEPKRVLLVVMTTDRGLCGSFNTEIARYGEQFGRELEHVEQTDYVLFGKKGEQIARRNQWRVRAAFSGLSVIPTAQEMMPATQLISEAFLQKEYDHVFLIYTDFVSTITQKARVHQLLPLQRSEDLGAVEEGSDAHKNASSAADQNGTRANTEFLFEPSQQEVLEYILPRLIEVQIYQAILESSASEHSARMVAMKNASEAASDMVQDLTFAFNQIRQSSITQEIAEIAAGKAALN